MIILLSLAFLALMQPEPPSPESEWYPPTESFAGETQPLTYSYSTSGTGTVPGTGVLNLQLVDINGRLRNEIYGSESFYLRFVTPFNSWVIFLYEWYPPGNVPKGHWLIWAAGPASTGAGVIINMGYFRPERGEPERQHVWKCWLWDPNTGNWAVGILRFNYYRFPRAIIDRVDYPQNIVVGKSYELKVYVRNLGEKSYTYKVRVQGGGLTFDSLEKTVNVPAQSTSTVTFTFTVQMGGILSVDVALYGDTTQLDSKHVSLASKALKPGPMVTRDVTPTTLKEGEEATLTVTFINKGSGEAKQVTAKIDAPGFMVVKGMDFSPNVPPGGSGKVTFTLRPLEGGRKTVKVEVMYVDEQGNRYSDTLEASLIVLVKLNVYAQDKDGNQLQIPITINQNQYISFSDWVDPTSGIQLNAPKTVEKDNVRYIFEQWSDGNTLASRQLSITKSTTLTAVYRVEYHVTVSSPYGEVSGEGWYPAGEEATISVSPT